MTYWNGTSVNQDKYKWLFDKYMPSFGTSKNKSIEIMRLVAKIYYGLYKNGDFSIYNGDYHKDLNDMWYKLPEEIKSLVEIINGIEYIQENGIDGDYNESSEHVMKMSY